MLPILSAISFALQDNRVPSGYIFFEVAKTNHSCEDTFMSVYYWVVLSLFLTSLLVVLDSYRYKNFTLDLSIPLTLVLPHLNSSASFQIPKGRFASAFFMSATFFCSSAGRACFFFFSNKSAFSQNLHVDAHACAPDYYEQHHYRHLLPSLSSLSLSPFLSLFFSLLNII